MISDYFSNFIEVVELTSTTSKMVVRELMEVFARFGVPNEVVTDNGPQFDASEFAAFAKSWDFVHTTSSLHYAQSNGKAENAAKRLFQKCKERGTRFRA